MAATIMVSGLPSSMTDRDLHDLFNGHGTIDAARMIRDWLTGHCPGMGVVQMSTPQEAKMAVAALDGARWNGDTLAVHRPKDRRLIPSYPHEWNSRIGRLENFHP